MENFFIPDLEAAAHHLDIARASLAEAVRSLRRCEGTDVLLNLEQNLGLMAEEFRSGAMVAGLEIPLVDKKAGARAMGRSRSERKLAALSKARKVLAEKRQFEKVSEKR